MDPEKADELEKSPNDLVERDGVRDSHEESETPDRSLSPEPELDQIDRDAQYASLTKTKSLEEQVSLPREVLVVAVIVLAQLLTQVGLGQTLAIIHIIGDHFGVTNPGVLSWLIAGYSLTVGTFILFTGRLGDLFGWKRMLVIGYVWFGIWSLVAGLSWYSNHVLFVFARVFQGIGPAIILPNGIALLGGLYTPGPRKNMAFAMFAACAPGGSILGSVMGSLFALTWWPWAFFSCAITLFCIAGTAQVVVPDPQDEKPGITGKGVFAAAREMDILGAAVGITALVLFNFAWNQAPIVGWGSAYIIVTLILGVVLVPVFFYIEIKVSPSPLLPLEVFTASNAFILACVACGWANFGIWVYYYWQIMEVLRGISPLLASAYLSPAVITGACAAITTGIILGKIRAAWVMVISLCAFMIGSILMATLPVYQIYWAQIFVTALITPFGMDMSFPSATLVVSDSVKKSQQGVAASLVNTIVNYSISLGLGFAGTVEVNVNNGGLTFADTLHGYRSALYVGIGLTVLGIFLAVIFVIKSYWDDRRNVQREQKEKQQSVATP